MSWFLLCWANLVLLCRISFDHSSSWFPPENTGLRLLIVCFTFFWWQRKGCFGQQSRQDALSIIYRPKKALKCKWTQLVVNQQHCDGTIYISTIWEQLHVCRYSSTMTCHAAKMCFSPLQFCYQRKTINSWFCKPLVWTEFCYERKSLMMRVWTALTGKTTWFQL